MNSDTKPSREQRVNEILAAYIEATEQGSVPDRQEWLSRHAEFTTELQSFFVDQDRLAKAAGPRPVGFDAGSAPTLDARSNDHADDTPGTTSFGDYELLEEIARGGMGVVYKARQVSLNRVVALKMILSGRFADRADVERFQREARTAANLRHPHIVAIFEVGEANGQHYFSMDFIEGRSLADVVRERPAPPADAAECVRTIARAMAFAHEQGVLHRDLKPSNILLDGAGQPHVADFGLARTVDQDKGLTATGAVVGTPSYMPPEQACGAALGPTSDVYSLGAILYELVTGRPPFKAATTIDTLRQVIDTEPVSPRLLLPTLHRDLETIILKCLAKDPRRRYASAAELADDLDAYLEDRPIQARRPSVVERGTRWAWRKRRALAQAGVVAFVSMIVALVGWQAWSQYADARLGRVTFGGEPGLTAEIQDTQGRIAVPRFALPREEPIKLPGGDYVVQLAGANRVSQTAQLRVLPADKQSYSLALATPWKTSEKNRENHELIDFGERHGVVSWDRWRTRLRRVDVFGDWAQPAWDITLAEELFQGDAKPFGFTRTMQQIFTSMDPPRILRPAVDLDGDGINDLVWCSWRHSKAGGLVAQSGKSGRPLWHADLVPPTPDGVKPGKYVFTQLPSISLTPLAPLDIDGDGTLDLITANFAPWVMAHPEGKKESVDFGGPHRWLQAVSGKTGKLLWHTGLDNGLFDDKGLYPSVSLIADRSGQSLLVCNAGPHVVAIEPKSGKRLWNLGMESAPAPPRLLPGTPDSLLFQSGPSLHAIRLSDGSSLWSRQLAGWEAGKPVPQAEIVLLGNRAHVLLLDQKPAPTLKLLDPHADRTVWQQTLSASWSQPESINPLLNMMPADMQPDAPRSVLPCWPLCEDLDGDGRKEIIVPHQEPGTNWVGLEVRDAGDGKIRWRQRWKSNSSPALRQSNQFAVGPDLDGDGRRELFVPSFGMKHLVAGAEKSEHFHYLFVEALSGKDGRRLWSWKQLIPHQTEGRVGDLLWWQAGADGWPQLVVPYTAPVQPIAFDLYVLTTSTGELAHRAPRMAFPQVADLDGDAIPDLFDVERSRADPGLTDSTSQRVMVCRGEAGHVWRRFGSRRLAGDMDRDGIDDLVGADGKQTLAIAGRDGRVLWQLDEALPNLTPPTPHADLDGDGVADLVGESNPSGYMVTSSLSRMPLRVQERYAVSGKTGRMLWDQRNKKRQGKELLTADADGIFINSGFPTPECHDLRGDGRGVLLYAFGLTRTNAAPLTQPSPPGGEGRVRGSAKVKQTKEIGNIIADALQPQRNELCIAALAGEDGRLLWKEVLSHWNVKEGDFGADGSLRWHVVDVTGDKSKEIVMIVEAPNLPLEMQVRNGSDGVILWKQGLQSPGLDAGIKQRPPEVLVSDLDGDGLAEIVLVDRWIESLAQEKQFRIEVGRSAWRVRVLNGSDGKERWTWKSALAPPCIHSDMNWWWTWAVAAKLDGIGPALCLGLAERTANKAEDEVKFVVLDQSGTVRQEIVEPMNWHYRSSVGLASHDLDGDGWDELLWRLDPHSLQATRGGFDRKRTLWTQSVGWYNSVEQPGSGQAMLLVRGNQLIDGATGKPLFELPGVAALLPVDAKAGPPRFVGAAGEACYLLPRMGADGKPTTLGGKARSYPVEPDDPRLLRGLPWVEGRSYRPFLDAMPLTLIWLAAPLLLLTLAVQRRSWRWGAALLVYAIFAVVIWRAGWYGANASTSITVSSLEELFEYINTVINLGGLGQAGPAFGWLEPVLKPLTYEGETRFARIALGVPLVLIAIVFMALLVRQCWRRLVLLAAATLFAALVLAGIDFALDATTTEATESYQWENAYVILLPAAYLVGLMLMVVGFASWLVRSIRRSIGRAIGSGQVFRA